ncbi:Gmad2 immunoglobulin-like domain-containing protein, partial [Pseudokineococcus marinus]|uniref:Gmad2 immunoglobulin-like domain-containing protein n=1 Tax=Pseudokineococcus marinus TaxID=351215 RepID=UPI0031D080EA
VVPAARPSADVSAPAGTPADGTGATPDGTGSVTALPAAVPAEGAADDVAVGPASAALVVPGVPEDGPVADADLRPLAGAPRGSGPTEGSTPAAAAVEQGLGDGDVPVPAAPPAPAAPDAPGPAEAAAGVPGAPPDAPAAGLAAGTTASAPRVAISGPAAGAALPAGCTVHLVGTATSAAEATVVWQVRKGTQTVLRGSSVVEGADGTAAPLGAQGSWEAFVDLPAGTYTVRVEIPDYSDGEGGGMPAVERSFTVRA